MQELRIAIMFLALLFIPSTTLSLAQKEPPKVQGVNRRTLQKTVQLSVGYLEKEGVQWMRTKKCASCHHIPMMVWALEETRSRGYQINLDALNEVKAWALDGEGGLARARIVPPPPKPDVPPATNDQSVAFTYASIYTTFAARSNESPDDGSRAAFKRLTDYLVERQSPTGTWGTAEGRPPVMDTVEIMTMWTMAALDGPPSKGQSKQTSSSPSTEKAAEWLRTAKLNDDTQSLVLRIFLARRSGESEEAKRLIKQLTARQNPDGGWSQVNSGASDAFGTGQVLYMLSEMGVRKRRPEIRRALSYLASTQRDDGSWPMNSRPTFAGGGPAKDLSIITYAGTAWATIGIVRFAGNHAGRT